MSEFPAQRQRWIKRISEQLRSGLPRRAPLRSTGREILKNISQNRKNTPNGFGPVEIDNNADPCDPNKVSFRRKSKVDTKPRMHAAPDKEDTRTVREEKVHLPGFEPASNRDIQAEYLKVHPVKKEDKLVEALNRNSDMLEQQYSPYPSGMVEPQSQAQMSISRPIRGKKDQMPSWQSGREDPSTDAQRSVKGRRHERWDRMTKPMEKKGHVPFDLAHGAKDITPTILDPTKDPTLGYAPGNAAGDEKNFVGLHRVERHPDRNGNPDHHFTGSNIPTYNRSVNRLGRDQQQSKIDYDQGRSVDGRALANAIADRLWAELKKVIGPRTFPSQEQIRKIVDESLNEEFYPLHISDLPGYRIS